VLALALESPLPAPKAESEVIQAVPPPSDVVGGQVARQ